MRTIVILSLIIGVIGFGFTASAQEILIPDWIKKNAGWWADGQLPDSEFLKGIQYLINEKIIAIEATPKTAPNQQSVPQWIKDTAGWWASGKLPDKDFVNGITWLIENGIIVVENAEIEVETDEKTHDANCVGNARCISGTVVKIVDGDTIQVDDEAVRFALASAPDLRVYGGVESRDFIQTLCPVGSKVIVDQDDSQTDASYGIIIGVVYCNEINLNKELLDIGLGHLSVQFCDSSEFRNTDWAQKHGCESFT